MSKLPNDPLLNISLQQLIQKIKSQTITCEEVTKIYLKRIEPRVKYLDLTINGKPRVMREGESLLVKETDIFKVKKIVTNIDKVEDIKFKIVPKFSEQKRLEQYEIVLKHKDYIFARLPMAVEDK